MMQKDIEKTLTAHRPETPKGFAERSDTRTVRLMTDKPVHSRRVGGLVIACALLLILGTFTSLAAANEEVNALLYEWWPEAARALMPVNLACEDQGIRMEILSAAMEENRLLVSFSLEDLEGERITENTMAFLELEDNVSGESEASSRTAHYDAEERKMILGQYCEYDHSVPVIGGELIGRIQEVSSWRETQVEMMPYLPGDGAEAQTMTVPADAVIQGSLRETDPGIPEGLQVLDCGETDFISLGGGVELAGMGVIDGRLHVQLHYTDRHMMTVSAGNHQASWPSLTGSVVLFHPQKAYMDPEKLPNGIMKLGWGTTDGPLREWEEYIFSGSPEAGEQPTFYGLIREYDAPILGNWEVKIPVRLIQGQK